MATRTFEVLSPRGWTVTVPHRITPGDVIRVLDDGSPITVAPAMQNGDSGIYIIAQVQKKVVVSVGTLTGVTEVAISFTG